MTGLMTLTSRGSKYPTFEVFGLKKLTALRLIYGFWDQDLEYWVLGLSGIAGLTYATSATSGVISSGISTYYVPRKPPRSDPT